MDWGMQPGNTNEHRFLKSLFLAKGKKKKRNTQARQKTFRQLPPFFSQSLKKL
jgi:hypothetical protein